MSFFMIFYEKQRKIIYLLWIIFFLLIQKKLAFANAQERQTVKGWLHGLGDEK